MVELERERTFLAREIPAQLENFPSEIIEDLYIPEAADHASLRLRHRGERYEITKKEPIDGRDSTRQNEHTILLTQHEYEALKHSSSKSLKKRRFYGKLEGYDAEVDVYLDDLAGLVIIDFEFSSDEKMHHFRPPSICLADVSQEAFIAAGKLAGKSYQEIRSQLEKYHYQPLFLKKENQK